MENEKLNLVRLILISPLFHEKSIEDKLQVLNQIIATGEVSQNDVNNLIQEKLQKQQLSISNLSYLEKLPYDVFINLIVKGNIEGKDLIRLCNSSPVLNEFCNRSFKVQDTNEIIPQYLFYLLVKKMGFQPSPNQNSREFYKILIRHRPFFSLDLKFKILEGATEREGDRCIRYSGNIYDLLYNDEQHTLGLLKYMLAGDKNIELTRKIDNLYGFRWHIVDKIYKFKPEDMLTKRVETAFRLPADLRELAKFLNITLEDLIKTFEEYKFRRYDYDIQLENYNINDLLNINQLFSNLLNEVVGEISDEKIIERIKSSFKNSCEGPVEYYNDYLDVDDAMIEEAQSEEETLKIMQDQERIENDIKALTEISELSNDEVDYLFFLHKLVLSGKLPVLTRYTFEELSKY